MKGRAGARGRKIFLVTIAAVIVIAALSVPLIQGVLRLLYPLEYEQKILECAAKHEVDAYLIMALIKAESNFIPDARSKKNAKGLMQITEKTGKWIAEQIGIAGYSFDRLSEPDINIEMGVWYLSYLLDEFKGDVMLSLCAYNAGLGNVKKWQADGRYSSDGVTLKAIPFADTRAYIQNIKKYKKMYEMLYPHILGGIENKR